ncbi:hypothetical protein [Sphingomicrobium sediminis]|uniref:Uncharacterized protein n=1 Tax=Sphingomicrobium sediminis TaxID=2950949 RepID=A0A9X2EFB4_9SPHN|nr:hypothetical protein [Sphingomicrobium sediminis]MCM8556920.1 hypothetical protein [Sphingomicrobium sediminis]
MGGDEVFALLIVVGIPCLLTFFILNRVFDYKKHQLEVQAGNAAEKAAQYAVDNKDLEQRVRVLEKIVTDGGAVTAAQIEALRDLPEERLNRQLEDLKSKA